MSAVKTFIDDIKECLKINSFLNFKINWLSPLGQLIGCQKKLNKT